MKRIVQNETYAMEWFTESLRTLNLDNLIMKTTDAPTEGEQPMPPYRRRVRIGQNDDGRLCCHDEGYFQLFRKKNTV